MSKVMDESRHPSAADLLLHMEQPDVAIGEHLTNCDECRVIAEELGQGQSHLVEYRRLYERRTPSPPPLAMLQQRLREETARPSLARTLLGLLQWKRVAALAAVATACVLLFVNSREVWNPASVEAAELLRHATAQPKQVRSFVVRQGGRVATSLNPSRLQLARINPSDPLNASDFAHWRDEQNDKRDTITRGDGWIRLTTAVLGDTAVDSASLTVSSRDWQPFARSVHFRNEEEIEFAAVPEVQQNSRVRAEATGAVSSIPSTQQAPVERDAAQQELEVRLWEILHETQADVRDSARLQRQNGGLCYELWADAQRRASVVRALAEVRNSRPCAQAQSPERPVRVLEPLSAGAANASTFQLALLTRFGDEERVDRYLDDVVQRHAAALARVTALGHFLRWFTPESVAVLNLGLRRRVDAMARDHVRAVRESGAEYLRAVSQGLEALRIPPAPQPSTADCGPVMAASSLADDLRNVQHEFSVMLSGDPAGEGSAQRTAEARDALAHRLDQLCLPQP